MRLSSVCLPVLAALPLVAFAGPVNINTADAATLDRELKGIGPARAAAIVAYRSSHGLFKTIDELMLVEGIGQKVIDDNREQLRVNSGAKPAVAPAARPGTPKKPAAAPPR